MKEKNHDGIERAGQVKTVHTRTHLGSSNVNSGVGVGVLLPTCLSDYYIRGEVEPISNFGDKVSYQFSSCKFIRLESVRSPTM